ncbi:biogenesis of lysosome-related organelles complex 1 subunit 1-like [Corticium candelabrum]|uniref:biogenesis of lysosome-related organelles complex 1 subunit 1-like n=1 Tax=Corticium candelabrum TaxID=121492 RepID=UPI002E25CC11|nr:biogenesis of lysosome-related organelles complex 1 subunit 1-like [Corticium candelabrum]
MLARALKEHNTKQAELKTLQEKRRKEAVAAADSVARELVDSLNIGVEKAYQNQKKLDSEAKCLQMHASRFIRQAQQWLAMVEGFNQALKELGDVENWARTIESDMRDIAAGLEHAYKGEVSSTTLESDSLSSQTSLKHQKEFL